MANKIQIRRGLKTNLPILSAGEPAFVTDANAEEFWIGNGIKNIQLARQDKMQTALDNKVEGKWKFYYSLSNLDISAGNETMDSIAAAMPNLSTLIYTFNTATAGNNPTEYPAQYGLIEIDKLNDTRTYIICKEPYNNGLWYGTVYQGVFYGWEKVIVKDKTITWYDLPLATGNTAQNNLTKPSYMKDNAGWVHVNGIMQRTTAPTANEVIATLPVGYRPSGPVAFVMTQNSGVSGDVYATYVWVHTDGKITMPDGVPTNYVPGASLLISANFKAA